MKIYATDTPEHEILKFVGKDLWIKGNIIEFDGKLSQDYYIHAKDVYTGHDNTTLVLHCSLVDSEEIDAGEFLHPYTREQLFENFHVNLDRIRLTQPLVILTENELMARISDINTLDKFIGTKYWIKVLRDGDPNDFDTFYIHIEHKNGYTIVGDWIEAAYVDDYKYDGTYSGPPSEFVEYIPAKYRDIRNWKAVRPLNVITDEELNDILEYNNEIFTSGYLEDTGEEYVW